MDVGGTKIAAGVVDELGAIEKLERVPTEADSPAALELAIANLVERLADGRRLPVGVAAAGFIDAAQSIVYYAPNIRWRNEPLRQRLEDRLNLQVVIDNDATLPAGLSFASALGNWSPTW